MCNEYEFHSDRKALRERFFKEAHKKTSLKEVGSLVDQIMNNERVRASINEKLGIPFEQHPLEQEAPNHLGRDIPAKELKLSRYSD